MAMVLLKGSICESFNYKPQSVAQINTRGQTRLPKYLDCKSFFFLDVQEELCKNGDDCEADFVCLVRNWFQACDERGIDAYTRVKHLQEFSEFLAKLVDWDDWPPPYNYI